MTCSPSAVYKINDLYKMSVTYTRCQYLVKMSGLITEKVSQNRLRFQKQNFSPPTWKRKKLVGESEVRQVVGFTLKKKSFSYPNKNICQKRNNKEFSYLNETFRCYDYTFGCYSKKKTIVASTKQTLFAVPNCVAPTNKAFFQCNIGSWSSVSHGIDARRNVCTKPEVENPPRWVQPQECDCSNLELGIHSRYSQGSIFFTRWGPGWFF